MAVATSQSVVRESRSSPIGAGLVINGRVTSSGEIRLDGQVIGDIHCARLVLGEDAKLEGSAVAEEVTVYGQLIGSARAVRLTLRASAHVQGDLLCQTLAIEQGAHFDGRSRRSNDPLPKSNPSIASSEVLHVSADKALPPMGGQNLGSAASRAGVVHQKLALT
jgi:cytoskeletal protein CcmA (bactofilin family)